MNGIDQCACGTNLAADNNGLPHQCLVASSPITPTPTDLDNSIIGCCGGGLNRHEVCSHVKDYIQAEIVKALETLLFQAREHTITDIEMIMHQTNGKVDFIEAVTTDQIIKYITALKEGLKK